MSLVRTFAQRSLPVLLVAAGFLAWPSARPAVASAPVNDTLEQAMGQLQQSMKTLGKGINAETKASALEELAKIQAAILTAKAQTPDTAAKVDEKKRADFVAEFRTTLLEALKLVCDTEIAVVNDKFKEAEGILRGKLAALKSAGHDKFKGND